MFGFSRGAYTARMVAGIINEIGILGRVRRCRTWAWASLEPQTSQTRLTDWY